VVQIRQSRRYPAVGQGAVPRGDANYYTKAYQIEAPNASR